MKRTIVIITAVSVALSLAIWKGCQPSPKRAELPKPSPGGPAGNIGQQRTKEPTTEAEYEAVVKRKSIEFAKANNAPISFYGRVVDQDGKRLQGVAVGFRVTAIPMVPVPWGPDETKKGSCVTDQNGLFSVEGMRGVSLSVSSFEKSGYRESGYYHQAHVRYEPYSSQRHIPNRDKPVEFMLIRDDLPKAEKVFSKILSFAWNTGPITVGCGPAVGTLVVTPLRNGMNPANKRQAFDWSVDVRSTGFSMVPLEENSPQVAPVDDYGPGHYYNYPREVEHWKSSVSSKYAIRTTDGKFGLMELEFYGDHNDNGVCGSVTIYINPSGSRNIDHK